MRQSDFVKNSHIPAKLIRATVRQLGGWEYPTYRAKVFDVHMVECDRGYTAEVRADGEAVARFKTPASAFRYISKVAGPLTNYV